MIDFRISVGPSLDSFEIIECYTRAELLTSFSPPIPCTIAFHFFGSIFCARHRENADDKLLQIRTRKK